MRCISNDTDKMCMKKNAINLINLDVNKLFKKNRKRKFQEMNEDTDEDEYQIEKASASDMDIGDELNKNIKTEISNKKTIKYFCNIHDNDIEICNMYECKGSYLLHERLYDYIN